MSEALLRAESVGKRFGRLQALRDVSLEVPRGSIVALLGRNGAGKTTFLRIAATLVRSFVGTVRLFGTDVRRADEGLRRRIGFLSHESMLYEDLSVRDNLRFTAALYGIRDAEQRIEKALDASGLRAKGDAPVRELSRGMTQRLAFARATIHEPEMLLLDEPTTGLDAPATRRLEAFLTGFRSRGGTALVATHDLEWALRIADGVVIFERGRVAFAGTVPAEAEAVRNAFDRIVGGEPR
jgi:heme exporter protein A